MTNAIINNPTNPLLNMVNDSNNGDIITIKSPSVTQSGATINDLLSTQNDMLHTISSGIATVVPVNTAQLAQQQDNLSPEECVARINTALSDPAPIKSSANLAEVFSTLMHSKLPGGYPLASSLQVPIVQANGSVQSISLADYLQQLSGGSGATSDQALGSNLTAVELLPVKYAIEDFITSSHPELLTNTVTPYQTAVQVAQHLSASLNDAAGNAEAYRQIIKSLLAP